MNEPFSLGAVTHVVGHARHDVRGKAVRIYAVLVAINALGWGLAFWAFAGHPLLLGTALLAYTFGLRHAVDADHISSIDNVTRKLMQDGQRPVGVGFFFSLGHSSVVIALTVAIAVASAFVKANLPGLQSAGEIAGTSVSAVFLLFIAAINAVVLVDVVRAFRQVRRGEAYHDQAVDAMLDRRGLMGRFFRPLLRIADRSWKMYPIGVLFGLGFDTASEVGLLGIAAVEAGKGLPIAAILIFPLLFTAGMSLLDTTDGILMLGAYGWAFVKPIRKLYYNMTITLVSVTVAAIVGGMEALSVVSTQLQLKGGFWDGLGVISGQFGTLGLLIIGVFVVSWGVSTLVYRLKRYDDLEPIAPSSRDS